jgi:hypothetical protein
MAAHSKMKAVGDASGFVEKVDITDLHIIMSSTALFFNIV